jgi:hypothetical protein
LLLLPPPPIATATTTATALALHSHHGPVRQFLKPFCKYMLNHYYISVHFHE